MTAELESSHPQQDFQKEIKEVLDQVINEVSQDIAIRMEKLAISSDIQLDQIKEEQNSDKSRAEERTNNNKVNAVGAAIPDVANDDVFYIRAIQFRNATRRIVMQSQNGPCPLIAAVNALSLLGRLTIPASSVVAKRDGCVARAELTDLVGSLIIVPPNISHELIPNYEKKVADVLEILPDLGFGLEVNVKFADITAFEYTKQIDLFDLLGLRLYHSWKVEGEYVDEIGDQTYSQVAEKAVTNCVLSDFLLSTQSQMTYSGLFALQESVPENAISILFRNNHFHTILRQNNKLYVLATDEGFLGQPAIWEVLENIEGDSDWVDMDFRPLKTSTETVSNTSSSATSSGSTAESIPFSTSDYELAKQLQRKEEERQKKVEYNRRMAAASQNNSPKMQPRRKEKDSTCQII